MNNPPLSCNPCARDTDVLKLNGGNQPFTQSVAKWLRTCPHSFTAGSCLWRRWTQDWCIVSDTVNLYYIYCCLLSYIVAALSLLYFFLAVKVICWSCINGKLLPSGTKSTLLWSLFCCRTRLSLVPRPLSVGLENEAVQSRDVQNMATPNEGELEPTHSLAG